MLRKQKWMDPSEALDIELRQSMEEGRDTSGFVETVRAIQREPAGNDLREELSDRLYETLAALPTRAGYPYVEPSDLEGIQAARQAYDDMKELSPARLPRESRYDKVYGALLGRCAGCLLGKPVEGWRRAQIEALLNATGNYPVDGYMRSDVAPDIVQSTRLKDAPLAAWVNTLHGHAPVDDDTNYTILGAKILSVHGMDFAPDDVAEQWLVGMPLLAACTAERVAYINIANRIYPPVSAIYRNPYREWIGAQIRADYYGYATPGRPELGAELAWRDASISHVKNGIYGAMFVAAMISAAAVCTDIATVLRQGLAQVPYHSRLAEAVRDVLTWPDRLAGWEQAVLELHNMFDEKDPHDWCHTIPNALVVCIGLLYGGLDFGKSIGIAVMSGFDTDCNGATVGSIVGMMIGAGALPEKWTAPLNDTLETSITGYPMVRLSQIAEDTVQLYWAGGQA